MNTPIKLLRNTSLRTALVAVSLSWAGLGNSEAVLTAYEGFNYTVGSNIVGLNGGTGWSDAWAGSESATVIREISSTSIIYDLNGFIYGGGNSLMVTGTNLTRLADRKVIRTDLTVGQDIYFSYIFQAQGSTGNLASSAFTAWYARDSTGINITTGNALISGSLQKAAARTAATSTSGTSPILQYDTTYLMVGRISGWDGTSYKTTSIWLNPGVDLGTPTATVTSATGGIGEFYGAVLRISGLDTTNTTFYFDDMRIGTTWDAVVIPEPATTVLLALAGLGIILFRWRSATHRLS